MSGGKWWYSGIPITVWKESGLVVGLKIICKWKTKLTAEVYPLSSQWHFLVPWLHWGCLIDWLVWAANDAAWRDVFALMTILFTRARPGIVATTKTINAFRVTFDRGCSICDRKFFEITALMKSMSSVALRTIRELSSYKHLGFWRFSEF